MIEIARTRKASIGLDMAPLIDVIFLLLIFFMLSSSFLKPALEVKLPQAKSAPDNPIPETIVISADREGHLALNGEKVNLDEIAFRLKALTRQAADEPIVHVKGDKDMPYGTFVSVMDQVRQAAVTRIEIVHENVHE